MGQIIFVLQQNFRQWKLINELRCFYKHLHFSETSDKLHIHSDVKHKKSLSCPAITMWTTCVRHKQICDHFYGSVWPTGHSTSDVMQNFWYALPHVKQATNLRPNFAGRLRYMKKWNYNRTDTMCMSYTIIMIRSAGAEFLPECSGIW